MWFLVLITTWMASAAELPNWVARPPKADANYHYFVGRASGETSERLAYRAATQDAIESAVRECFGVVTSINVSDFESSSYHALDKRLDESSSRVRLEEFEQLDSYSIRDGEKIDVYLLYRYPLKAIANEKQRLAKGGSLPTAPLSEAGEVGTGTTLQVVSKPAGAEVFVDEVRWGITPVAIRGALKAGIHHLSIRHPEYTDVDETVIVPIKREKKVVKVLEPATGTLAISSLPAGAEIMVDGIARGKSPVRLYKVPAGKKVVIETKFNEQDTIVRQLQLDKGETRRVLVELPEAIPMRQPAYVAPPTYVPEYVENRTIHDDQGSHQSAWIWGLGFEAGGANIPEPFASGMFGFELTVEKRFFYRMGLRASGAFEGGYSSTSSSSNSSSSGVSSKAQNSSTTEAKGTLSGSSFGLGLPIYFSSSPASFYIMPEFGGINYSYEIPSTGQDIAFSYQRKGITLGFQDQSSIYNLYVSFYDYDWGPLGHHAATSVGAVLVWGR